MSQQSGSPTREATKSDAITVAIIALAGTIITAMAAITVALLQRSNPGPGPTPSPMPSPLHSSHSATTTPPATPDGVTYRCRGFAPGINITYGPSGSDLRATRLPFTAHEGSVSGTAQYYAITAQLNGGGHVTCTVTVTHAGHTTTSSGTARGGYTEATPEICADYQRHWYACS